VAITASIFHSIAEVGGRLRVRSALNPALWLCAIVTIPLVVIIAQLTTPPIWLIFTAIVPVGAAVFGFLFLLIFDRDKLQSEDYQIRKRSLELIQEKGQRFAISAPSIEAISNPRFKELPSGDSSYEEGGE